MEHVSREHPLLQSTASFSSIGGDDKDTVRVAVRVRPLNRTEVCFSYGASSLVVLFYSSFCTIVGGCRGV